MEETITPIYRVGDVLIPADPAQIGKRMMVIKLTTVGQEQKGGGVKWRVEYDLLIFENDELHTKRHVGERVMNSTMKMIGHKEPLDIFYVDGFDGGVCNKVSDFEKTDNVLKKTQKEVYGWTEDENEDYFNIEALSNELSSKFGIPKDILLDVEQLNKSSQLEPTLTNKEDFKNALTKSADGLDSLNAIYCELLDVITDAATDCRNASEALKALAKFDPQP